MSWLLLFIDSAPPTMLMSGLGKLTPSNDHRTSQSILRTVLYAFMLCDLHCVALCVVVISIYSIQSIYTETYSTRVLCGFFQRDTERTRASAKALLSLLSLCTDNDNDAALMKKPSRTTLLRLLVALYSRQPFTHKQSISNAKTKRGFF